MPGDGDDVQAHATTTAGLCGDGDGDAFGGCRLELSMAGRKERKGKDGEVFWKVKYWEEQLVRSEHR